MVALELLRGQAALLDPAERRRVVGFCTLALRLSMVPDPDVRALLEEAVPFPSRAAIFLGAQLALALVQRREDALQEILRRVDHLAGRLEGFAVERVAAFAARFLRPLSREEAAGAGARAVAELGLVGVAMSRLHEFQHAVPREGRRA